MYFQVLNFKTIVMVSIYSNDFFTLFDFLGERVVNITKF